MHTASLVFASMPVKLCIFLWLLLHLAVSAPRNRDEGELVLVSVIFRHGARTPDNFYTNDPYQNETFYPFGLSQLTNPGRMGEFKLGQYLRSLYKGLLGKDYIEDKVYVRSTDWTRTKMSAQLVLAGLFPPSKPLVWNEDLLWLPIPVSYKSSLEEDLFHPYANCPYKIKVLSTQKNIAEVQEKFINPYKDLYEYVEKHSGESIKDPTGIASLFFVLKTEADFNFTLPEWTQEVYPGSMEEAGSVYYAYHNYDPIVKQINTGFMLKKILEDSDTKIDDNTSSKKIYLYSGHEATVGYMLDALQIGVNGVFPSYGSALSFELRKLNENYYIKLRLRNDPDATVPQDLIVPGCSVLCPIDQFKEIVSSVLPSVSLAEICENT